MNRQSVPLFLKSKLLFPDAGIAFRRSSRLWERTGEQERPSDDQSGTKKS